jgi:DNA end-binding protein Ku
LEKTATKTGHFDPAEFEDRYETAVVDLPPTREAPVAAPATVVNLMDALRRSVEAEQKPVMGKGKPAQKVSKTSSGCKAG